MHKTPTKKIAAIGMAAVIITCIIFPAKSIMGAEELSPRELLYQELGSRKALLVNGDDFGRNTYCNQGIIKAFEEGILTSTSLQTPGLATEEAYEYIKAHPDLDVGVHLILARDGETWNEYGPLIGADSAPNIVDSNGNFLTDIFAINKATKEEIDAELRAQIAAALDKGVDITHLDCHKGWCHTYQPKFTNPYLDLAQANELPLRWTGRPGDGALVKRGIMVPDRVVAPLNTDDYEKKKSAFIEMLRNLDEGVTEVIVHPGVESPYEADAWRAMELRLVLDPDVRAVIEQEGIALVGWRQIRDIQRKTAVE